jgi:hypothetical protein
MSLSEHTTAVAEALERCSRALRSARWTDLRGLAQSALDLARIDGDQVAEGRALRYRGIATQEMDGGAAAASDYRRAATIFRTAGDARNCALTESDLAGFLVARGDPVEALGLIDSAEHAFRELGLEQQAQECKHRRAFADLVLGDYESALRRAREAVPLDRAMMSLSGEGWALEAGALAATFAGDLDTAQDFAGAFLSLARIGNEMTDLLEAHLVYHRVLARRGEARSVEEIEARLYAIDGLNQPAMSATARVILADARLGAKPDLLAFAARDECEPFRQLVGPWLAAELRHLDARWSEMPIRREGDALVVDLGRPGCLPAEHLILDYARTRAAQGRSSRKIQQAADLSLTRRHYYKVLDAIEERLSGAGRPARQRRLGTK